jgi:hypothetical protein
VTDVGHLRPSFANNVLPETRISGHADPHTTALSYERADTRDSHRSESAGAARVLTTGRLGVEDAFTELGMTLERPVAALFEWTAKHADVVRVATAAFEATAGNQRDAA